MRFLWPLFLFLILGACGETSVRFYSESVSKKVEEPVLDGFKQEIFEITKNTKHPLDILIVVDSSSSMNRHLENLGKSLSDILSVISNYDWQIAFTTVDHGDHEQVLQKLFSEEEWEDHASDSFPRFGNLMFLEKNGRISNKKILTQNTTSYEKVFYDTLSHSPERDCSLPPFCHKYLEQPLRSLKSALERSNLDNESFFRSHADFVSIIVTNEDERDEDAPRATSAQEVIQTFNSLFSFNKKFLSFGIIVNNKDCLNQEFQQSKKAQQAKRIAKLAQLTGGKNLSICAENYSLNLQKISNTIKNHIERSVFLKEFPFVDSVEVEFLHGTPVPWTLSRKKLVFKGKLTENTQIRVQYQALED